MSGRSDERSSTWFGHDTKVARLLDHARNGSREAMGELWEGCREYLLVIAERRLGGGDLCSKGAASDLVQQTFLEGQRNFSGFRGQTRAELMGWLVQILVHNVANHRRSFEGTQKRDLSREIPLSMAESTAGDHLDVADDTSTPSRKAVRSESRADVQRALERLPDHYRRVIELRHYCGWSFREIGSELGRSPAAARMLWVRSLERLAHELETSHSSRQPDRSPRQ